MNKEQIFNFKTDISGGDIPKKLNNPFGSDIPEIGRIAAKEFQEFIINRTMSGLQDPAMSIC